MSEHHRHKITVNLRWGGGPENGFSGDDMETLMASEIVVDRPVVCQFAFSSTCEGVHSWRIIVEIGVVAALVGKSFMDALGKDLYEWSRDYLKGVFAKKKNGDGWAELRFEDVRIMLPARPSDEEFADMWLELPGLIEAADFTGSEQWFLERDPKSGKHRLVTTTKP